MFSWNKGILKQTLWPITPVHGVINKVFSRDSNYIVDLVMWSKLGNSSFSITEVIITQFYKDLIINFFEGFSWFKFNKLGLVLGMVLKFYSSMEKVSEPEVTKFWDQLPTFAEVIGESWQEGRLKRGLSAQMI